MNDPLGSVTPGQVSPFVKSAATVNMANEILRQQRQNLRGPTGGQSLPSDGLPPSARIYIRNDTGTNLDAGAIVKLGAAVTAFTGDDSHEFRKHPVHKGTAPAASTDTFAILEEPAAAVVGSGSDAVYSFARAVVLGEAVCDVNMTTTFPTHSFASPSAADTAKLVSGTSGPVKIIDVASGTGTKRATVLLTGQMAAAAGVVTSNKASGLAHSISASGSFEDVSGSSLTLTEAGQYLIIMNVTGSIKATSGLSPAPFIMARVLINSVTTLLQGIVVTGDQEKEGSVGMSGYHSAAAGNTIKLQAYRSSGHTYTTSSIVGLGAGGDAETSLEWIRLSD